MLQAKWVKKNNIVQTHQKNKYDDSGYCSYTMEDHISEYFLVECMTDPLYSAALVLMLNQYERKLSPLTRNNVLKLSMKI